MSSIEDLVTSVLREESKDAPDADAFVNRILGEIEPERTSRPKPRWDLSVPVWTVPLTAAAVAALIVLAAVMSSLWLSVSDRDNGGVTTPPSPTSPTRSPASTKSGDHEGRLPGWISLTSGTLHIEMEADATERMWWRDWTIKCSLSVLSTIEIGDFACAGQPGKQPMYEVMVGPALEPANLNSAHISIDGPLASSEVRGGLDGSVGADSHGLGGQQVEVQSTTAEVRYNCPGSCGQVVRREVTVIGFLGRDAHLTILSPVGDSLVWLTDYVYTDPEE